MVNDYAHYHLPHVIVLVIVVGGSSLCEAYFKFKSSSSFCLLVSNGLTDRSTG